MKEEMKEKKALLANNRPKRSHQLKINLIKNQHQRRFDLRTILELLNHLKKDRSDKAS